MRSCISTRDYEYREAIYQGEECYHELFIYQDLNGNVSYFSFFGTFLMSSCFLWGIVPWLVAALVSLSPEAKCSLGSLFYLPQFFQAKFLQNFQLLPRLISIYEQNNNILKIYYLTYVIIQLLLINVI